jgi:MFS superfamily sulfate permease-like transporter
MLTRLGPRPKQVVNVLQIYSNTQIFHRANGQRLEAAIVTLIGLGSFFVSSHVLPYVPTILASTLVLYVGIELLMEALWDSSGVMVWYEWVTVTGTTVACSFLGFAPGIGAGLVISTWIHFLRDSFNSVGPSCERISIR